MQVVLWNVGGELWAKDSEELLEHTKKYYATHGECIIRCLVSNERQKTFCRWFHVPSIKEAILPTLTRPFDVIDGHNILVREAYLYALKTIYPNLKDPQIEKTVGTIQDFYMNDSIRKGRINPAILKAIPIAK